MLRAILTLMVLLVAAAPAAASSPAQLARLAASQASDGDGFGSAVAISGSTIVVGSQYEPAGGTMRGAAYVFELGEDGVVRQVARLVPTDPLDADYFGLSVAIDGDLIAVGAPGEIPQSSFPASNKDAVYVFQKPSGGWRDATQTAKLTATAGSSTDLAVGWAVAVTGTTVVATGLDGSSGPIDGRAFVYERPGGGWVDATQTATLIPGTSTATDFGGRSVAADGDDIVVGMEQEDGAGVRRGGGYVFTRPAGGWVDATGGVQLLAASTVDDAGLGFAAAIDDGVVVLGAPGGAFAGDPGAAFVYVKPASGWAPATERAKLAVPDAPSNAGIGITVSVEGGRILVGELGINRVGAAYLFDRPATGWTSAAPTARVASADVDAGDRFGQSVAQAGTTLVVAARGPVSGATPGAAYAFTTRALAPTGLRASSACATGIAFAPGADGGSTVTGYERSIDGGAWRAVDPETIESPALIAGLERGATSAVRLRAVTSVGAGYPSAALDVAMPAASACLRVKGVSVASGGVIVVRARVGSAGTIEVTGRRAGSMRTSQATCTATRSVRATGDVVVRCPPNAATRRRLMSGPLRVALVIRMAPTVGDDAVVRRAAMLPKASAVPVTG